MGIYMGMSLNTETLTITPEILTLIAELDEFKGAWRALGTLAPERLSALRRVATIESIGSSCRSRILMQPSEDRNDEGHGPLGIQQHCRVPLLVRDDRPARRYSRIGVFAKDGSNRDTKT